MCDVYLFCFCYNLLSAVSVVSTSLSEAQKTGVTVTAASKETDANAMPVNTK